jgi:predicted nucleotide-binding protein (sugar kinase/HSP70/actin superfamily)
VRKISRSHNSHVVGLDINNLNRSIGVKIVILAQLSTIISDLVGVKFLVTEYKTMQKAMEAEGFDPALFSNVKKKGRLNIHYKGGVATFTFFRKKETKLDDNMKWIETKTYTLDFSGQQKVVYDWEAVLVEFSGWLKTLS